ncbi:undecaprenyl diphosphate synthase [Chloroherpeton thalassium ATCC 35110]|uniref:Isoprenyl transferase n=1 Tax=Chloroherpeton thalassium (strain ATCC 35110 / GB-78) TaxID=517418 RepID=B3QYQ8_CHLT3|nr:isoprenyl transferase [Chloroherpeton thalassium]ACF15131.1 undecaprenyl diphosphate synthase [Chloroherpeton thalassium ATCC 35110]
MHTVLKSIKQVAADLKSNPEASTRSTQDPQDAKLQESLKVSGAIPEHIAIIMDGNGRWAKSQGQVRVSGHHAGLKSVRDIVEACAQLGVKYLTLYAFSKENWRRPKTEVAALMRLLVRALREETQKLHENNIRLNVIGNMQDLPQKVSAVLHDSMALMKQNTKMTLTLALSYSGRWEILQATKRIAEEVKKGFLHPDEITDATFEQYLATAGMPNPELLIRTSGEFRLSNFLLWQLAYTEIYISNNFWPDFRRNQLYDAIRAFQQRERRYGLTSEQIGTLKPAMKSAAGTMTAVLPSDNQR